MGATFSDRPSAAGPRYVFSPAVTDKKAICSRSGIASLAKDGVSINFKLNAFPVDGRGTLIVPKQDEAVDSSYREA